MKRILLACDFMGFKPNLYMNGELSYKSSFTGVLSILIAIISILCTGYFGSELILKSVPAVVINRDTYEDFGPLPVSNKGFLFLFGMEYANYSYYTDPTVFQVEATAQVRSNILNKTTGLMDLDIKSWNVKMDICSKFYSDDDIVEKNMKLPLDSLYCAEPDQFNFTGFWGSQTPFSIIRVEFNRCQNSTEKKIKCRSPDEIDSIIQNGYMSFMYTGSEVDQLNYLTPLKRILFDDYNLLNADSSLEYAINLEPLKFQV
jgi:hypothetical protein